MRASIHEGRQHLVVLALLIFRFLLRYVLFGFYFTISAPPLLLHIKLSDFPPSGSLLVLQQSLPLLNDDSKILRSDTQERGSGTAPSMIVYQVEN